MSIENTINIKNKKASFEFAFIDNYTAGIQLTGTEIKSIREGKVNINDTDIKSCNYECNCGCNKVQDNNGNIIDINDIIYTKNNSIKKITLK